MHTRYAAISADQATPAKPSDGMTILENQRLQRPVSPHLGIYKPQIPWILSGLNRITGSIGTGAFYILGASYALFPFVGLGFTSAGMAAGFAKWPLIVKGAVKMTMALPIVFHSLQGVRHLMWDVGYGLTNQAVIRKRARIKDVMTYLSRGRL
ncbi:MAG: hypothetical protein Q9159_007432 [Coniocarpon cinnabarinum]